jgi:hypothetical protein
LRELNSIPISAVESGGIGAVRQSGVVHPQAGRTLAIVTESEEQLRKVNEQVVNFPLSISPKLWVSRSTHLMQYSIGSVKAAQNTRHPMAKLAIEILILTLLFIDFACFLSKQR